MSFFLLISVLLLGWGCGKEPKVQDPSVEKVERWSVKVIGWEPLNGTEEESSAAQKEKSDRGIVVTLHGFYPGSYRALILQPNGNFLAAGIGTLLSDTFQLTRFTTNGELDTSFATAGSLAKTMIGGGRAYAATIQIDGNILLAGLINSNFGLARYTTNGALDTTFNTAGTLQSVTGVAYATILQTDGNILLAGDISSDFGLARYTTNGALDTTFNTTGSVQSEISGGDGAFAVMFQTDAKIILAGIANTTDFGLARYTTNGALDTTFNITGTVQSDISGTDTAYAATLQADGKILLIGIVNNNFGLARYATNGTLDTAFNTTGTVQTNISGNDYPYAATLQADGKIILSGVTNVGGANDFGLCRYNTNGTLDTTFNITGKVQTDITGGEVAYATILLTSGKIVLAGRVTGNGNFNFSLLRYNTNGTLDTSFVTTGNVMPTFPSESSYATKTVVTRQALFVGGSTDFKFDFLLAKYLPSGQLDTSFGTIGRVQTSISGTDTAYAITLQTDGNIILSGATSNTNDFGLARYATNGTLDTTFNTTGTLISNIGSADRAYGAGLQLDGKIVLAGIKGPDFGIARYTTNGALDTTFNTTGTMQTDISGSDIGYATLLQTDGRAIIAGNSGSNFGVARYTTNGTLDTTFNITGTVNTNVSGTDAVYAATLQLDGKIIVAGIVNSNFALARYNTNGTLDTAFRTIGTVQTNITGTDLARDIQLIPNGRILVAGNCGANPIRFCMARYFSNGALDTSFVTSGTLQITIGEGTATAYSIGINPEGQYIAAGASIKNGAYGFTLVRIAP